MKTKIAPIAIAISMGFLTLAVQANETPGWFTGVKVKNDLRLRYEGFDFDEDGKKTRNRFRYRLRLGATKALNDRLLVGLRLASGSGDPTSTNQSFDNSFSGKDIVIDRVFLTYEYKRWEIGAGKTANPFHTTNMVWDSDVNPEGFYQKWRRDGLYLTLGEMLVEEESSDRDTNLYSAQLGYKGGGESRYNLSASYYFYQNLELGGLGRLDYGFVDLLASVDFQLGKIPATLKAHLAQNVTSEIKNEDTAWAFFLSLGKNKRPGDWSAELKYAEIEAFSVNGAFADSDFGFADKQGFQVKAGYQAAKPMTWFLTIFSIDSILAEEQGFNRVQLDCSLKF